VNLIPTDAIKDAGNKEKAIYLGQAQVQKKVLLDCN
jgi:hypothetical protein